MSEPDAGIKSDVIVNLEGMGFTVLPLEERIGRKTADLLASKSGEKFLIEIKTKSDDQGEFEEQLKRLCRGEVVMRHEYWGPKNTIARIIRSGVQQIEAHTSDEYDFSLLWLHAEGIDADSQFKQFEFTLYGRTNVFSLRDQSFDYDCYYFYDSAFYRWRALLDGAILSVENQAQLCINTYSPKAVAFRTSEVVKAFGKGVLDPLKLESEGKAIVADCDVDRRNESSVIGYLQRKYNQELLMHMHVGRTEMFLEVPTEEEAPNPYEAPGRQGVDDP
jgi:hypothetical protein